METDTWALSESLGACLRGIILSIKRDVARTFAIGHNVGPPSNSEGASLRRTG